VTSGHRIDDGMTPVTTQAGPGSVGFYYERIWNGGDSPTARPPKVPVVVYLPFRGKDGLYHYGKPRVRKVVNPPRRTLNRPDHDYEVQHLTKRDVVTTYDFGTGPYTCTVLNVEGSYALGACFQQMWSSNDDLALLGKLREKVAGSDFNCLTFLAEGHESLELITNAATRIYRMYHGLKTGNIRKALGALEGINPSLSAKAYARLGTKSRRTALWSSRTLLELEWGWKPLLSDAKAGAEWFAQHSLGYKQKYVVRSCVQARETPGATISFPNPGDYKSGWAVDTRSQIKAVLTEVNAPVLSGLLDPLSTVWELLPLSCVADWFYPLGSFLSARALSQSLSGKFTTTKTVNYHLKGILNRTHVMGPEAQDYSFSYVHTTRTVTDSLSVPLPTVKPLGKSLSFTHCAEAVALLVNAFGGKP